MIGRPVGTSVRFDLLHLLLPSRSSAGFRGTFPSSSHSRVTASDDAHVQFIGLQKIGGMMCHVGKTLDEIFFCG